MYINSKTCVFFKTQGCQKTKGNWHYWYTVRMFKCVHFGQKMFGSQSAIKSCVRYIVAVPHRVVLLPHISKVLSSILKYRYLCGVSVHVLTMSVLHFSVFSGFLPPRKKRWYVDCNYAISPRCE